MRPINPSAEVYECRYCELTFPTRLKLKTHKLKRSHLEKEGEYQSDVHRYHTPDSHAPSAEITGKPIKYKYHCSPCGYKSNDKHGLKLHKQTKRHKKNFEVARESQSKVSSHLAV